MAPKVFIVTGASKGIGLAVTRHLVQASHKVVLAARSADLLESIKQQSPAGSVEYIAGDLNEASVGEKLVDLAVSSFGRLDGVVLNHSVLQPKRLADSTMEEIRMHYESNVFSCVAIAIAAIPQLRSSSGAIVWVSSGAATKAYASWSSYGSSKAAINAFSAHVAAEEPSVISVAVQPGRVDTDMQGVIRADGQASMDKAVYDNFVAAKNDGILLKPEQPGNVIARLVAAPNKDVSGLFLAWNGPELKDYQE